MNSTSDITEQPAVANVNSARATSWSLWTRQIVAIMGLEIKKNFFSRRALLLYPLVGLPIALGTKNNPSIAPLATTRHFMTDETARAISDNKMIHAIDPKTIEPAIHRFDHSHPKPVRET